MKFVKMLCVLLCVSLLGLSLCACATFLGKYDEDQTLTNTRINTLLDAIENKDKDKVISLFSKEAISDLDTFEKSIENLFDYYQGIADDWDDRCPKVVDALFEDGQEIRIIKSSFDIKTSKESYRIAMKDCAIDTTNEDNVGIWSLYIIKLEDDTDPEYAYWGDGKETPGIHVGVKNNIR